MIAEVLQLEDTREAWDKIENGNAKFAWQAGARLDEFGGIWLSKNHLARAIGADDPLGELADFFTLYSGRGKQGVFEGETFLNGAEVGELARSARDENVREASRKCYEVLEESDYADFGRRNLAEVKNVLGKKVKQERKFTKFDGLTGDAFLFPELLEFTHIRLPCFHDSVKVCSWNGIMVCEETRNRIREFGVADEIDLFELCRLEDWSIDWAFSYAPRLEENGFRFRLPNDVVSSRPAAPSSVEHLHAG